MPGYDRTVPRDISQQARFSPQRRNLFGACLTHMLHDGYTDQLYALLPVWQSEFGLSYAGLAAVIIPLILALRPILESQRRISAE